MENNLLDMENLSEQQLSDFRNMIMLESVNRMEESLKNLSSDNQKIKEDFEIHKEDTEIYKQETQNQLEELNEEVVELKDDITLNSKEQGIIQKTVARKVYEILSMPKYFNYFKDDDSQNTKRVARNVFPVLQGSLRAEFNVSSYKDIRRVDYQNAQKFIRNYVPKLYYR